eukprot:3852736-Rhodomonas_salina.1
MSTSGSISRRSSWMLSYTSSMSGFWFEDLCVMSMNSLYMSTETRMYAVARSSVTEALKMCDSIVILSGVCESVLRETRAKSAYCTASP